MGSSFQYGVLSGFRAISQIQNTILRNAQGYLSPGFNKLVVTTASTPNVPGNQSQVATRLNGSRNNGATRGGDSLYIAETNIHFDKGTIDPAKSPTSLAIKGEGFFVLAENLNPGAAQFLTRNGEFHYDAGGRLVNAQGLFVVGGNGAFTDPPTPVRNPAPPNEGTVPLPEVTLAVVRNRAKLSTSNYGNLVYQTTTLSGDIQPFPNGSAEVGFVQASSLEIPKRGGLASELQLETSRAQQHYKIFKDMLEKFEKSDDDAISLVK